VSLVALLLEQQWDSVATPAVEVLRPVGPLVAPPKLAEYRLCALKIEWLVDWRLELQSMLVVELPWVERQPALLAFAEPRLWKHLLLWPR